jgi:uncharacterized protein (DUF885 family)
MQRRAFLIRSARAGAAAGMLCQMGANAMSETGADGRFAKIRERYFLKTLELNPVTSTYLGGDGYSPTLAGVNGRLRDYRPEALAGERKFYLGIVAELKKINPAELSPANRIDHSVVNAQIGFVLHQIDDLRYHERSVDTYVVEPFRGIDWQIQQMTDAGGGLLGTEQEWALVAARAEAIPAYLAAARSNLVAGKASGNMPDRRMVRRDGIDGSRANVEFFQAELAKSAKGYLGGRPFAAKMLDRIAAAGARAADAYKTFAAFFEETYDPNETTDRFAVGEKEYQWRVTNCLRDPRSPQELFDYGAEQVALYEARIFEAAGEVSREAKLGLAFGADAEKRASVRAVMDYLSKDSPKDDEELFRWYRETGVRAVAYGREHGLFDVPAAYRLDVLPTPAVLGTGGGAAYYPAPPFKKTGVGRFYLSPTGNDPAKLKLNNRASVADTAIHEGFPGHDWHYKYMSEHAREISNVRWLTPGEVEGSASMWEDSMASEGWGLYSEELMAEAAPGRPHGFYTAGEYMYELQGQLLRAVRVRVDVGIHTGRMTFDEAVDYFNAHVNFAPDACARAGADPASRAICDEGRRAMYRYSKWPTQAITYNLGKNAIVRLREAYKAKVGAQYSAKSFHERLMRMGTIPAGYYHDEFLR